MVLSSLCVELAKVPKVRSVLRAGENIHLSEQLTVLGKCGKKMDLGATRLAVDLFL